MTDITPYLQQPDILDETVKQIIKDFNMVDITLHSFPKIVSYQELFTAVFPHIEKLVNDNSDRFHALMYRIDISESQIKKVFAQTQDQSFSQVITDMILKREVQKVVLRKTFSK